jgi:hypothetical protein
VRALRSGSRTFGRLTAGARLTPSFLIVGAQRCGTTSLFKTLAQHPAVLPSPFHKGVHYFDVAFDRPLSWYTGHFPLRRRAEEVQRRHGMMPITGESSPYYMFHPLAPSRIASVLPDVKIIVLLRDPVERAYSAHSHELARGYEREPFERALKLEAERTRGEHERLRADGMHVSHHHQHHSYLARGQYVDQLEVLEQTFGRDRLHVIDSDEFFADGRPAFDAVCDFLGLPAWPDVTFGKHNARSRAPMAEALRCRLVEHFEPYDTRLEHWWGRAPSWRR